MFVCNLFSSSKRAVVESGRFVFSFRWYCNQIRRCIWGECHFLENHTVICVKRYVHLTQMPTKKNPS